MSPAAAAIVMMLATAAYGAFHSLLAGLPCKQFVRRLVGASADRFYRLGFNIVGTITLLPLLAFAAWQPGHPMYTVPPPLAWVMLSGQAAAVVVIAIGVLQTGAGHFLGLRQLVEPDGAPPTLTTSGLYRFVRHPLYTAGFVFLWLTPLMTSTLFVFYLGLSVYLVVGSVFEERRLVVELGPPYRQYQREVPRLVPAPWRRRAAKAGPRPG